MKKRDLFIVLLILMNVALIIKNAVLSRNIRTLNALSPSGKIFAPHFVLVDLNREVWTIERIVNNARYTMLVFFSPQDCPSCLLESSLWESIYKSQQVARFRRASLFPYHSFLPAWFCYWKPELRRNQSLPDFC